MFYEAAQRLEASWNGSRADLVRLGSWGGLRPPKELLRNSRAGGQLHSRAVVGQLQDWVDLSTSAWGFAPQLQGSEMESTMYGPIGSWHRNRTPSRPPRNSFQSDNSDGVISLRSRRARSCADLVLSVCGIPALCIKPGHSGRGLVGTTRTPYPRPSGPAVLSPRTSRGD